MCMVKSVKAIHKNNNNEQQRNSVIKQTFHRLYKAYNHCTFLTICGCTFALNESVIKTKSKLDRGLGNLWTSRSLLRWGYFERTNAFLVYALCFHEIVHDKWCLYKSVRQTENDLERGFVKHQLNSV